MSSNNHQSEGNLSAFVRLPETMATTHSLDEFRLVLVKGHINISLESVATGQRGRSALKSPAQKPTAGDVERPTLGGSCLPDP